MGTQSIKKDNSAATKSLLHKQEHFIQWKRRNYWLCCSSNKRRFDVGADFL